MTQPIISLVSGTYNRIDMLRVMVQSFRDNLPPHFPYEIILVDGGSTDGSIEWALAQPDIKLIQHGELRGAIKAFTEGANTAKGEFVIMANDDIKFGEDSVLTAYCYLQDHMHCGAVAFTDNRPIPGFVTDKEWHTLKMPASKDGRQVSIVYAQVGMFRRWLGRRFNWWTGANQEMAASRVYAGDNFLSAKIWEAGYTVDDHNTDPVLKSCYIIDYVADDELRQITLANQRATTVNDSDAYYSLWGRDGGPMIPLAPTMPQQDTPSIRVLYLPIYEPGWAVQKVQKRGLRDALMRAKTPNGWNVSVYEFDYLAVPAKQLEAELLHAAALFQPRIILTQLQGHLPITPAMLSKLRSQNPRASIINWNGDVAEGGLISPEVLLMLRYIDLQLVVNASVLPVYEQLGIAAAYWQIGYEDPQGALPDMPAHDVVFLGSFNNPARLPFKAALERLRDEQITVGIFEPGDASATLYDFAKGKALYNVSKIGVGSNEYPDNRGFVSNRLFQAIAAGGCLYFQQKVEAIQELTGIQPGKHFVEFLDFEDFHRKVQYYLAPANEAERKAIAETGTAFVRQHHSFDARVAELFALMKQHIKPYADPEANAVYLRYLGRMQEPFGIPSKTNERLKYQYEPGKLLLVDRMDAAFFLSNPELWELAET